MPATMGGTANPGEPLLHPDRLFPPDPATRDLARRLHESVERLPILSPHGHTDPRWYAENAPFPDPARLLIVPDHYTSACSTARACGWRISASRAATAPRWRPTGAPSGGASPGTIPLFRGTPTRLWLDHTLATLFGMTERLSAKNADAQYDAHRRGAATAGVPPARALRALQHRGDRHHRQPARRSALARDDRDVRLEWRVVTAYRPDAVVDPEFPGFAENLVHLGEISGEDTASWQGYLAAHEKRRRSSRRSARLHRSRAPERADRRPRAGGGRGALPSRQGRARQRRRRRTLPRADADRDGAA